MGGQLDGIFLAGSLPHEFIILIVTLFICLWLINLSLSLSLSLSLVRGSGGGQSPPEAESILVIGCPTEPENLAPLVKFSK